MIANRLNVLLAERQLSIKEVVKGTNLSRNTISNLINKNMNNSINLSTLNSLCMFLEINPKDFFVYSPYDLDFNVIGEDKSLRLSTFLRKNNDHYIILNDIKLELDRDLSTENNNQKAFIFNFDDKISKIKTNNKLIQSTLEINSFSQIIQNMDIMFQNNIKNKVKNKIIEYIKEYYDLKDESTSEHYDKSISEYVISISLPWDTEILFFKK